MNFVPPTSAGIAAAAEAIRAGEVVAYPTETVYGLAVDPFNEQALERLVAVKGREEGKPVLLIVAEPDQASRLTDGPLTPRAAACAAAFWPGPLSLVLPGNPALSRMLLNGEGRVCVRCPSCETARALCRAAGGPLTSTSANRSGEAPARCAAEADLPGVALVLDGGALAPSPPSTVFDPERGIVLREGAVALDELEAKGLLRPS